MILNRITVLMIRLQGTVLVLAVVLSEASFDSSGTASRAAAAALQP